MPVEVICKELKLKRSDLLILLYKRIFDDTFYKQHSDSKRLDCISFLLIVAKQNCRCIVHMIDFAGSLEKTRLSNVDFLKKNKGQSGTLSFLTK